MSEIDWDTQEIAEHYDQNCDHQFYKGQLLVDMMGISTGDYILDLGCGTGRQAEHIFGIIGDSGHLTGVDPSSHRLEIAKKRFESITGSDVLFFKSQAENLDYLKDSFYNYALFCSSFHWVEDKPAALAEVYRVLKSGGGIGMTTLNREGGFTGHEIMNKVLKKYGLPECYRPEREGMKRVSSHELEGLLKNAGFTDISIELKMISKHLHFGMNFLNKPGKGSFKEIISTLDEPLREEIRAEFIREYEKYRKNPSFGPGTLFALAKKQGC